MPFNPFSYWKCLFVFFFLISSTHTSAKAVSIDSLENLLEIYEADTNRVRILNKLTNILYKKDLKKAQLYGEEASNLAKQLNDLTGQRNNAYLLGTTYFYQGLSEKSIQSATECLELCRRMGIKEQEVDATKLIANNYYTTGKVDSAAVYYQKCWDISKTIGYVYGMMDSAKSLGDIFESRGKYDKALEMYRVSLKLSIENKDKETQGVVLNAIGIIYDYTGKIDSATVKYFQALHLAEEIDNLRLEASACMNIAYLFRLNLNKDYEKALSYSFRGLEINKKIDQPKSIAHCYQDIAYTYRKMNQLDTAKIYYAKAIEIRQNIGDKRGLSFSYNSLGQLYLKENKLLKARQHFEKGLRYSEEIGLKRGISNSLRYLGNLNLELKDYPQALIYLNKSKEMALQIMDMKDLDNIYRRFVKYNELTGNYKAALAYHKLQLSAQDSLFKKDQNKKIAEVQALYETEKNEKQITQQKNDIYELEIANVKVEKQRNYLFGGTLLLGIFTFLGFKFNSIRKERNDKIAFTEALIFAQEEERKRIARDLHDGVGQSLLLMKKQLVATHEVTQKNHDLITDTLEEVRSISQDLHPFQLEKFGLTTAINEVIQKVEKSTDLFITKEIDTINKLLDDKAEINLYRTIQEAFNNIVKHSEATAAKISIQKVDKSLIINIQDNGKGFDHELAVVTSKSLGLRTMFERITSIGGKLKIENGVTKGTMILIRVPV